MTTAIGDPQRMERGLYWDRAWNLASGCTPVSVGCANCWSFNRDALDIPTRPRKPTIFAVWTDLFHEGISKDQIFEVLETMQICNRHRFLALTKRSVRMRYLINEYGGPITNVALGVTVESEASLSRLYDLCETNAALRYVSYEPALGPVDFTPWLKTGKLHWVIAGGESGRGARPCNPSWIRGVRDQCAEYGVPLWFKQWGPRGSGRLIDGVEYRQRPEWFCEVDGDVESAKENGR